MAQLWPQGRLRLPAIPPHSSLKPRAGPGLLSAIRSQRTRPGWAQRRCASCCQLLHTHLSSLVTAPWPRTPDLLQLQPVTHRVGVCQTHHQGLSPSASAEPESRPGLVGRQWVVDTVRSQHVLYASRCPQGKQQTTHHTWGGRGWWTPSVHSVCCTPAAAPSESSTHHTSGFQEPRFTS